MKSISFRWRALILAGFAWSAHGANPDASILSSLVWSRGPTRIDLSRSAEFSLPAGYLFLDGSGTKKLLAEFGNKTSGREIGFITSQSRGWFVIVEFLDVGYVRDDGWRTLDTTAMLRSLQRTDELANSERLRNGWATVTVQDWDIRPRYDPDAHQMEWAVQAESSGATVVNHTISILGRGGVVQFCLVDPDQRSASVTAFRELVRGFSFKSGERYVDHQARDRIASGDLMSLVGGVGDAEVESEVTVSRNSPSRTTSGRQWSWGLAVLGAAIGGFVSGRFNGRRKPRHRSRANEVNRRRPAESLAAHSSAPTLPAAPTALAAPAASVLLLKSAPQPADAGPTRKKRFDSYSFYVAMSRDLHWTINY